MINYVEYIWLDGTQPSQQIRSKTRILSLPENRTPGLADFPEWSYDGSSTNQSTGNNSDLNLVPVRLCKDPIRGEGHYLLLCEVSNEEGTPHETNTRAILRKVLASEENKEPWFGFEQEYTLYSNGYPLGWPNGGYPAPQGPFYCGVGADKVYGREIVEKHMVACSEAGLHIYGINAEVMPGQWEFQIGYRGFDDTLDGLVFADHLQLARWLLQRIAEDYNITVSFENKPMKGDWNGAGCHTNFSTKEMRSPEHGREAIQDAIHKLNKKHLEHVRVYGAGLESRLTGLHETCSIHEFKAGVAHRGASIRVPSQVHQKGYGYIEDRRPGANCDPYLVCARLIVTICNINEEVINVTTSSTLEKETTPELVMT